GALRPQRLPPLSRHDALPPRRARPHRRIHAVKVMVVTNMYPSAERPHWGAFVRSQVESLSALGVENVVYEIEGWKSTARYAHAMRELPVLARRAGADLVHAHY